MLLYHFWDFFGFFKNTCIYINIVAHIKSRLHTDPKSKISFEKLTYFPKPQKGKNIVFNLMFQHDPIYENILQKNKNLDKHFHFQSLMLANEIFIFKSVWVILLNLLIP